MLCTLGIAVTDWEKIRSQGIIKKTVALDPIWDHYIRQTWAILIENGYDATYSTALNYMLLTGFFLVVNQGIDEKTKDMIVSFLEDKKTLEKLNQEDLWIRYREQIKEALGYIV
jgi:hypothetical protein